MMQKLGAVRRATLVLAVVCALFVPVATTTAMAQPAVAAPASGTIGGVVKRDTASGAGFAGLTVYLGTLPQFGTSTAGLPTPDTASQYRSATTAADGTFTFSDVPFSDYGYSVSVAPPADSSYAAPLSVYPVKPQPLSPDLITDFVLDQAGAQLSGSVVSAQGGAVVPGAVVIAQGPVRLYTTADSKGAYRIKGLRTGSYSISASAAHFGDSLPTSVAVSAGQTVSGAKVAINRLSVLSGTVTTSDASSTPLQGIVVSIVVSGRTVNSAVTDAAGRYSIADVKAYPKLTILFSDPNGRYTASSYPSPVTITTGVDITGLDARLSSPSSVVGTVTAEDAARTKIAGAVITLRGSAYPYTQTATTDAQGAYVIDKVQAGDYRVTVDLPSSSPYIVPQSTLNVPGNAATQRYDIAANVMGAVSGVISAPVAAGSTPATVEVKLQLRQDSDDGCCSYRDAYVQTVVADASGKAPYRFASVSPVTNSERSADEGLLVDARYVLTARVVSGGSGEYVPTWWRDATTKTAADEFGVPVDSPDVDIDLTVKRPLPFTSAPTPTISGAATVGSTLTAVPGIWSPSATRAYSWSANGVAIPGATSTTYTLTDAEVGKKITLTVVGTKTGYATTTRTSAATATVTRSVISGTVTVAGDAVIGSKLTVSQGSWAPAPVTLSTQWLRNGTAISGATATTYTLTADDVGATISARVTGSRDGYVSASATSAPTAKVVNVFRYTVFPTISGTPSVGSVLTAKTGTWTPGPASYRIQWLRDGVAISGATSTTYTVVEADFGHRLSVNVTPVKSGYLSKARTTSATSAVIRMLTLTPTPAIAGAAVVGNTLLVSTPGWGPAPVGLTFQWSRDGRAIPGATGTAYTLVSSDLGTKTTVSVTGTKAGYVPVTKVSMPTRTVTAAR